MTSTTFRHKKCLDKWGAVQANAIRKDIEGKKVSSAMKKKIEVVLSQLKKQ